jgi:hypothetical protein
MRQETQTRIYQIEAPAEVLDRFESLMLLLQRNASIGHSAKVGMPLDGDGWDRPFKAEGGFLSDVRDARNQAMREQIDGHGYDVEIAYNDTYGGYMFRRRG